MTDTVQVWKTLTAYVIKTLRMVPPYPNNNNTNFLKWTATDNALLVTFPSFLLMRNERWPDCESVKDLHSIRNKNMTSGAPTQITTTPTFSNEHRPIMPYKWPFPPFCSCGMKNDRYRESTKEPHNIHEKNMTSNAPYPKNNNTNGTLTTYAIQTWRMVPYPKNKNTICFKWTSTDNALLMNPSLIFAHVVSTRSISLGHVFSTREIPFVRVFSARDIS